MRRTIGVQTFSCLAPDRRLHERRPAEQIPFQPKRLAGPFPKAEIVAMFDDKAVAKYKPGLDAVHHRAPCLTKGVAGGPVRPPGRFIGRDAVERERKTLCALHQHAPHVRRLRAVQGAEHGIAELHIFAIAGRHDLRV